MNCNPSHLVTHRQNAAYTYCQHCGEITDINGKTVVPRSTRCPNWIGHHVYDACPACGNDERAFPSCKSMNKAELAVYRVSVGLDPESPFMTWLSNRQVLINRINEGELIAEKDYLNDFGKT